MINANASRLVGELKDHLETFKRPEIKVANDKKKIEQLKHDSVLFSNPRGTLLVNSHLVFSKNFNHFPDIVYSKISVFRSYWLGYIMSNPQPIFEAENEIYSYISNALVNDLVEMSAGWKVNFNRTPATEILDAKNKNVLIRPEMYRDWFKKHFGNSTYTSKVIPMLAEGKSVNEILEIVPTEATVFDGLFKAPIVTKQELEKVLDILSTNPEPQELRNKKILLHDISEQTFSGTDPRDEEMKELKKQLEEMKSLILKQQKSKKEINENG